MKTFKSKPHHTSTNLSSPSGSLGRSRSTQPETLSTDSPINYHQIQLIPRDLGEGAPLHTLQLE